MEMLMVAVFDDAMQMYQRPFCVVSERQAVRAFADEVNRADSQNQFYVHPEDFSLYLLGHFYEASGLVTAVQPPSLICRASHLAGHLSIPDPSGSPDGRN